MKLEVEQKYRIERPDELRRLLTHLGASFRPAVRQIDSYFNHPSRDFAQTDEALRIRTIGKRNFVTYKGPKLDSRVKTRRELEQPLADGAEAADRFCELLTALGFRATAVVAKWRASAEVDWRDTKYELAWDTVDALGEFLEIELVVDETERESAQTRIAALETELQCNSVERRSYLEMVLARGSNPRNSPAT
ncbi:MAG: class IV adenylate cyclase [Planctomycetaceae bacterium]|nr:class IV adenylate cyclase [Planctomycetaceae bacterium]